MRDVPRGFWIACLAVFVLGFGLRVTINAIDGAEPPALPSGDNTAQVLLDQLRATNTTPRTVSVHRGLGAWVDAFDFSPSYSGGDAPRVRPDDLAELAAHGVTTVYLQAARADERAPGRLLEEPLLAEFLIRAHAHGIRVVGWYLPLFIDVTKDLDHLVAIAEFEALGHRFDGVAVDIESQEGVRDPAERSARLVELSERLRAARPPGEALGAIVLPTVQIEVVNTGYWPGFPWGSIRPHYDVWLPMAYSTFRTVESGYRDPYTYAEESVRRMRANLGDPEAPVHVIGGIGDLMGVADFEALARAAEDTGALGVSVYDWDVMSPTQRRQMADALAGP